jgi:hypothetical protein
MIKYDKPENLNGAELLNELINAGVIVTNFPMIDDDGKLYLDIDETDKLKAAEVVSVHNGTTVPLEITPAQKLASVGLSVDDLKAVLGL